jgi:hypothetical protein
MLVMSLRDSGKPPDTPVRIFGAANIGAWAESDGAVTKNGSNLVSALLGKRGEAFGTCVAGNELTWIANAYNGKPCLRNTGATRGMVCAVTPGASCTVSIVVSANSSTNGYVLGDASLAQTMLSGFVSKSFEYYNNADRLTFSTTAAAGLHILTVTRTASDLYGYYDSAAASVFHKSNPMALGQIIRLLNAQNYAYGSLSDWTAFVVANVAATGPQLTRLHAYLRKRWGTP